MPCPAEVPLNKEDETDSEGGLKAKVEIRGDRRMVIVSKEKERREGWRAKRKGTEGGKHAKPTAGSVLAAEGGRRRPSKSASLLSTPPTSSPPGASEATELRITNGRHWPGKKL